MLLSRPLSISIIAPLPSPNCPADCGYVTPRKPGWNGLRSTSCLKSLAGLDEGRVGEAFSLASQRRLERVLAADPHGEMRPVEVHRPLVGAAGDDGRDPGRLELLHRPEQIVPGLDRVRVDAGLGEEVLVVEEADLRRMHRHAVDLAVARCRPARPRERTAPSRRHPYAASGPRSRRP